MEEGRERMMGTMEERRRKKEGGREVGGGGQRAGKETER
jgi:hypothetical protein